MKKSLTILLGILFSLSLTSLHAQTTILNFTADEGYASNGMLHAHVDWSANNDSRNWQIDAANEKLFCTNIWQRGKWKKSFKLAGEGDKITFRTYVNFDGTFDAINASLLGIGFSSQADDQAGVTNIVELFTRQYQGRLQIMQDFANALSPDPYLFGTDCDGDELVIEVTLTLGADAANSTLSAKLKNLTDNTETVEGFYTGINDDLFSAATTTGIYGYFYTPQFNKAGSKVTGVNIEKVSMVLGTPSTNAPTGDAGQSFCALDNPTVADLAITGSNIKWYDAATDGSEVPSNTALVHGKTYYASQTVEFTESTSRLAVTATLLNTTAPTGESMQRFNSTNNPTVADLMATGNDIIWYTKASGGEVIENTTALTNEKSYYASQTVSGCVSSSRLKVTVELYESADEVLQGEVDFTAQEGYNDEILFNNANWSAKNNVNSWTVNSASTGTASVAASWQRAVWGQSFTVAATGDELTLRSKFKFGGTLSGSNKQLITFGFTSAATHDDADGQEDVVFLSARESDLLQLRHTNNSNGFTPNAALAFDDIQGDDLLIEVTLTLGADAASSTLSAKIISVTDNIESDLGVYTGLQAKVFAALTTTGVYPLFHSRQIIEDPTITSVTVDNISVIQPSQDNIFTAGTWTKGRAPLATDNVYINANYTGAGFTCNSLTVEAGKTVEIGNGTLEVNRDLINNGSMFLIKSGASLITYDGGQFIGKDISIERNTRYEGGQYSFVGSIVKENKAVKGKVLGKAVYKYDETVAYGDADNAGLDRWKKASRDVLMPGKGYTQAYQKMIKFIGEPNNGDITFTGTYTEDATDASEGWNLIANPYPAGIDADAFLRANIPLNGGNTTGSIYLWDDNGSDVERGTNEDYIVINGTGVTGNSRKKSGDRLKLDNGKFILGAGQGFFVQLIDNSNLNISFTEEMRKKGLNEDNNFFRQAISEKQLLRLNLQSEDEQLYGETLLGFLEDATDGVDLIYDAKVFSNSNLKLYSLINHKQYAIQGLPLISEEKIIPLGMDVSEAGTYKLGIEEIQNLPSDAVIELVDTKLNTVHNLSANGAYTFETEDVLDDERFLLNIKPTNEVISSFENKLAKALSVKVNNHGIELSGNPQYHVNIMDITGKLLVNKTLKNISYLSYQFTPNKLYIIKVNNTVRKYMISK